MPILLFLAARRRGTAAIGPAILRPPGTWGQEVARTVSACANAGQIHTANTVLVDAGARGGGTDPNAVSSLNGGDLTTAVCSPVSLNPPRPSCSTRPSDLTSNPVCADPTDRAAHRVVGQPAVDR